MLPFTVGLCQRDSRCRKLSTTTAAACFCAALYLSPKSSTVGCSGICLQCSESAAAVLVCYIVLFIRFLNCHFSWKCVADCFFPESLQSDTFVTVPSDQWFDQTLQLRLRDFLFAASADMNLTPEQMKVQQSNARLMFISLRTS
jgi:hypothetical protein